METSNGWTTKCLSPGLSIFMLSALCYLPPVALGLDTPTQTATPTPRPCVGDCDNDGRVTIDELVAMVNMALAGTRQPTCVWAERNADGAIDVSEIIDAVNAALYGCAVAPLPTVTPSPTGATGGVCGNGKVEPGETCDDANTVNGDGCEHCVTQPGYTCVDEPSFCYLLGCGGKMVTCSPQAKARLRTTPTPPPPGTRRRG